MAWEENPRICLHMQLIAILSRIGVTYISFKPQANRLMKHLREDSEVFIAINYDEAEKS